MDKKNANRLLARLAAHGTPPTEWATAGEALPLFSVGLEMWIDRLSEVYLRNLCCDDAHFKIVLAPYGGGKTHFLMALGVRALSENYAISYVQCVPDKPGSPARVDNPLGLYGEIANHLQITGISGQGVPALLEAVVDQKRKAILAASAPDPDRAFGLYLRSLRNEFPAGIYGDFADVVSEALKAHWNPNEAPAAGAAAEKWLQGAMDSMDPMELKSLGMKRIPASDRGVVGRRLTLALAKFTRHAGCNGLTLLIDELETLFNAKGKALKSLLGAMRVMVDWHATITDGVPLFCVFSAVPDVLEQFTKFPALQQRFAVAGATFEQGNDYCPQISLEKLGLSQESLLAAIGERLVDIAAVAAEHPLTTSIQVENARKLAKVATKLTLDVNARRLFIKAWTGLLQLQIRAGEKAYEEDELAQRYRGEFDEIRRVDEEVFEP
jgi:hypothetical protein